MSSIRPLITITILALTGVFLYMKINETEPPLPEGVEDWSASADIQFDMGSSGDMTAPQFAPSTESAPPAFSAAPPAAASAPAFDATAAAAPAFASEPPASSAGSSMFGPSGSSYEAPATENVATSETAADPVASTDAPSLPELPPLPDLPVAAPATAGVETPTAEENVAAAVPTNEEGMFAAAPPADATQANLTEPPATEAAVTEPTLTESAGNTAQAQSSLFSSTRLAVQAALDRGELSQALLLLSDWYDDPSLAADEREEVNTLLSQLAGSVIYSTEHRLEPPYLVQAGDRLETIAKEYDVPWQLLAKINGITSADQLQPGQKLKVVRGPFAALIDISKRKLTLMLDRRYAGEFNLSIDPSVTVEEGHWEVNQKLLTPASAGLPGTGPVASSEERSLLLANTSGDAAQVTILRGAGSATTPNGPAGRVLQMASKDAEDVYDILSLGSKVVIRR